MTLDAIKTVAVIGAGTMGNGIAHVFAKARLFRHSSRRGPKDISTAPSTPSARISIAKSKKEKSPKPINPPVSPASKSPPTRQPSRAADFAVEAVPEQLDLKERVLQGS